MPSYPHDRTDSDTFAILLFGEVDATREAELGELVTSFSRSESPYVDLDLTSVTFLDSTGLAAVSMLQQIARDRGGVVRLLGASRAVRRILEITGMIQLCDVVE